MEHPDRPGVLRRPRNMRDLLPRPDRSRRMGLRPRGRRTDHRRTRPRASAESGSGLPVACSLLGASLEWRIHRRASSAAERTARVNGCRHSWRGANGRGGTWRGVHDANVPDRSGGRSPVSERRASTDRSRSEDPRHSRAPAQLIVLVLVVVGSGLGVAVSTSPGSSTKLPAYVQVGVGVSLTGPAAPPNLPGTGTSGLGTQPGGTGASRDTPAGNAGTRAGNGGPASTSASSAPPEAGSAGRTEPTTVVTSVPTVRIEDSHGNEVESEGSEASSGTHDSESSGDS